MLPLFQQDPVAIHNEDRYTYRCFVFPLFCHR